ncbi:hypothetical protein CK203_033216 [Vitis vinifera]|uniref:Uncharacterized protein n=1 Tax=Vitis vinifera TaxID=29760 RepID=A0A438HBY8_VITVI|nr:hypothetical protein CK203_033216 [Vitis vinifera]
MEETLPWVEQVVPKIVYNKPKEDSKSEDLCGLGIASSMKMSSTSMVMMLTMTEGALLVEAVRFSGVFTSFASLGGGVVVLWDNWVLDLLQEEVGAYSISCHFQNYEDDFKWAFTRVYGHILSEEKEAFWAKLIGIKGLWRDPWRVGGDFNIARFLGENRNCSRSFSYEAFFKDNKRIQVVGFAFDLRSFYLVWGFV